MGDAEHRNSKNQKDIIAKAIVENFSKYARKPSNGFVTNGRTSTTRSKTSFDKLTSGYSDWSPRSKCFTGSLMQSRTNVACTTGSNYMLGDSRSPLSMNSHTSTVRSRPSSLFRDLTSDDSRFSVSDNDVSPESVFDDRRQPCYRQQGSLSSRVRGNQGGANLRKLGSDESRYMEDDGCDLGDTRKASGFCCELESDDRVSPPFRTLSGKQMRSTRRESQLPDCCGRQNGKESFSSGRLNGGDSMFSSDPFSANGEDSEFSPDSFQPNSTDLFTDSFDRQDDSSCFAPGSSRGNGKTNGNSRDTFSSGLASPFVSESCRPKAASRPVSPRFCRPNGETSRLRLNDFEMNGECSPSCSLDSVRQGEGGSSQFVPNSCRSNGGCCPSRRDTTKSVCDISRCSYDPCKLNGSSSNFSAESFAPNGTGPSFSPDSFKSNKKSQNFRSNMFRPNDEDSCFSESLTCIDKASNFSSNAYRPNGDSSNFSSESLTLSNKASSFLSNSFRPNGEGSNFPVDPCGTASNGNSGALNCCVAKDCCEPKEDWEDPSCLVNICGMGLDEWFAVSPSLQKVVAKLASKSVKKKDDTVLKDLVRLKAANILPPDFDIPGEEQATEKCEGKEIEASPSQMKLAAEKLVEHIVCRAAKMEAAPNDKNVDLSECDCFLEDVVMKISSLICGQQATDQKKVPRGSASESQRTSKASSSSSSKTSSSKSSSSRSSSSRSSVNSSSNNSALKSQYQLRDCICNALMQNCLALLKTDPSTLEDLKNNPDIRCATMTFTARSRTWQNANNSHGNHGRIGSAETNAAPVDKATEDEARTRASVADKEREIRYPEAHGSGQDPEEDEGESIDEDQLDEEGSAQNLAEVEGASTEAVQVTADPPHEHDESNNRNILQVNDHGGLAETSSDNLPPTTFLELQPEIQRRESVDNEILRMLEACLEDCSKLADSAELRSFVMEVVYGLYSTVRSKLEKILKHQADDASPGSLSQPIEDLLSKADQEIRELVLPTVIEHIVWLVRQDAKQRGGHVDRDAAKALAGEYVDTIVTNAVLKVETDGKSRRPFAKTFVVTSNDARGNDSRLNDVEVDNVHLLSRIAHAMEGGRIPTAKDTQKTMRLSKLQNQRKRLGQLEDDLSRLNRIEMENSALQGRIDQVRKHGGKVDCWNLVKPAEEVRDLSSTLSCRAHRDVKREEREFAKLILQTRTRSGRDALAVQWLGYAQRLGPFNNYPPKWWNYYRAQGNDSRLNDVEVDNVHLLSRIAHSMEGGRIPTAKDTQKTMRLSKLQNQRKRLGQLE